MKVIGDYVAASLRIYLYVRKKYFSKSVNLSIGGDLVQGILWCACEIDIPKCIQIMIIHCDTIGIDHNKQLDITIGIIKTASTAQEKCKMKIVITGLLL